MEAEIELNDVIQEMHVIATVPYLYHILVDLNAVQSILQLLNHENTGELCHKSQCHTKRGMGAATCAHPSFGMTTTKTLRSVFS